MGSSEPNRVDRVTEPVHRLRLDNDTLALPDVALEIRHIKRQLMAWHRQSQASQSLETIPGVGIITATTIAVSVPDPSVLKSAPGLGLAPARVAAELAGWQGTIGAGFDDG